MPRRTAPEAVTGDDMGAFWDARARENAAYFIASQFNYRTTDMRAFWASGPPTVRQIFDALGVNGPAKGAVVVEIGCGIGRLTRPLAEGASRVVALDVSPEMIGRARKENPALVNVEWVVSDGVSLAPVTDGAADIVFSHVVFQHIPDPEIVLGYVAEMGRILRPGGWAAFQISDDPSIHRPWRQGLMTRLKRMAGCGPRGQDHPAWLGSAVPLARLREAAADGGLATERVVGEGTQFCLVLLRRR